MSLQNGNQSIGTEESLTNGLRTKDPQPSDFVLFNWVVSMKIGNFYEDDMLLFLLRSSNIVVCAMVGVPA
jgi:hypothetical protein